MNNIIQVNYKKVTSNITLPHNLSYFIHEFILKKSQVKKKKTVFSLIFLDFKQHYEFIVKKSFNLKSKSIEQFYNFLKF